MSSNRHRYAICVANRLDTRWSDYLEGAEQANSLLSNREGVSGTRIVVSVADQAELMGILNTLHDFGMQIDCVFSLEAPNAIAVFGEWPESGGSTVPASSTP